MPAYTGALSFTDDARNAAVDAGVMVKSCISTQGTPPNYQVTANNVELLSGILVSKVLLQQQVHGIVGDKLWNTVIVPHL
jgi:hypothetical protein